MDPELFARFERAVPMRPSEFGLKMFARGVALVREHGVLPEHIMWDADEVLWDWTMDTRALVRNLPETLRHRELGHAEHMQLKPGAFELLWGIRLEALAQGHDPRIRIWTNGYAWRLWAIAEHVPGFATLLGLEEGASWERFEEHEVIFCRADYVRAIEPLYSPTKRMMWFEQIPWRSRESLKAHLAKTPFDSTFKLPELAPLVGKVGFDQVYILIDDQHKNAHRFARTARVGIHVPSEPLRSMFSLIPNASWQPDALSSLGSAVMEKIADCLVQAPHAERGVVMTARSTALPFDYEPQRFVLQIPDARIRQHWIEPMEQLRARHQSAFERLGANLRVARKLLPTPLRFAQPRRLS